MTKRFHKFQVLFQNAIRNLAETDKCVLDSFLVLNDYVYDNFIISLKNSYQFKPFYNNRQGNFLKISEIFFDPVSE